MCTPKTLDNSRFQLAFGNIFCLLYFMAGEALVCNILPHLPPEQVWMNSVSECWCQKKLVYVLSVDLSRMRWACNNTKKQIIEIGLGYANEKMGEKSKDSLNITQLQSSTCNLFLLSSPRTIFCCFCGCSLVTLPPSEPQVEAPDFLTKAPQCLCDWLPCRPPSLSS